MPRGRKDIKNDAVKFTKDYQPTGANKSAGKQRINRMKEALEFLGARLHSTETLADGTGLELSYEAQIGKKLIEMAIKGDLKAIALLGSFLGWEAEKKQNINIKSEWLDWIKSGNVIEFTKQPPPPKLKIRPIE